jgi:hypothetical protein
LYSDSTTNSEKDEFIYSMYIKEEMKVKKSEFHHDEDKTIDMEIDSDSNSVFEFININEVKNSNHDEKISCLEISSIENEEIKAENKNISEKNSGINCTSVKLKKSCCNFFNKCQNLSKKKIADKCNCNKPHFAKGLCKRCYDRIHWRNLPKPDKMCIKCNSKKAIKARNYCKSCSLVTNKTKPLNCNCDKPHYAKGFCRNCYYKINKTKQLQKKIIKIETSCSN